ncbi:FG-GAP repeat domain-containing protein [Emticicia agri]|uniref:VCBS repeat-containing protein n=1 Tax=Emticicia agri TaxID=2492393 RepID=A0A4Q5M1P6_9BACT|nr:VCBS repeat-containing protein [Emticicia agri]RYU96142.1 VCBS repeat-containing protein [Emticicia agri]
MTYKIFTAFALLLLIQNACSKKEDTQADLALAEKHCGSCHLSPTPNMLDKNNWEKVLPKMGLLMGVNSEIKKQTKIDLILQNSIPSKPLVSEDDWERLKSYYVSKAPYSLNFPLSSITTGDGKLFKGVTRMPYSQKMPNITCIKIDTAKHMVYAADEINQEVWVLDKDGNAVRQIPNHVAISDIQLLKNNAVLFTYMGTSIDPSLKHHGYIKTISPDKNEILLTSLYRPTQTLSVNLDENSDEELVINEFGVLKGSLSVWKKQKGGFEKYIIENSPGAIKTIPIDFDKDGKLDLITLFGQGDERIVWYKNKGNLQFTATTLLRFPPVYGSSSFDLVDMNKDGLLDILYTAGDNSDYSVELKPYHGLYIFSNQGKNAFKQTYFYQMNGAYKAVAKDFDLDGDLDLATIAFFVDYFEKTPKDFVFFENNTQGFTPKVLNIKNYGRWLVMDTGDIDGDGDEDIVLGNHPVGITPGTLLKEWIKSKGVLLLVNQSAKKK